MAECNGNLFETDIGELPLLFTTMKAVAGSCIANSIGTIVKARAARKADWSPKVDPTLRITTHPCVLRIARHMLSNASRALQKILIHSQYSWRSGNSLSMSLAAAPLAHHLTIAGGKSHVDRTGMRGDDLRDVIKLLEVQGSEC